MKKISHRLTFIYGKVLPIILLLTGLGIALALIFTDVQFRALLPFSLAIMVFTLGWIINYRNLEVVFIDGKSIVVSDNKILFDNIISINKNPITPYYKVRYYDDNEISSFKFLSRSSLYITPLEIKEIQKLIKNRNL